MKCCTLTLKTSSYVSTYCSYFKDKARRGGVTWAAHRVYMYLAELLVSRDLITGFWLVPLTLQEAQVGHWHLNKDVGIPSSQLALPPAKTQAISPLLSQGLPRSFRSLFPNARTASAEGSEAPRQWLRLCHHWSAFHMNRLLLWGSQRRAGSSFQPPLLSHPAASGGPALGTWGKVTWGGRHDLSCVLKRQGITTSQNQRDLNPWTPWAFDSWKWLLSTLLHGGEASPQSRGRIRLLFLKGNCQRTCGYVLKPPHVNRMQQEWLYVASKPHNTEVSSLFLLSTNRQDSQYKLSACDAPSQKQILQPPSGPEMTKTGRQHFDYSLIETPKPEPPG